MWLGSPTMMKRKNIKMKEEKKEEKKEERNKMEMKLKMKQMRLKETRFRFVTKFY